MQYHDNPVFHQLIESIEAYFSAGDLVHAADEILQLHDLTMLTDDSTILAASAVYSGVVEQNKGNAELCVSLCKKALSIGAAYDSPYLPYFNMRAYGVLAGIYVAKGDFYAGLGSCLNAYHIANTHPEYQYDSVFLYEIGNLFAGLSEYELALGYLANAYDAYREHALNDRPLLVKIIFSIVEAYHCAGEFNEAKRWATEKFTDWSAEERAILDCMLLMNEVALLSGVDDAEKFRAVLERFLSLSENLQMCRYLFRCYLFAGHQCIQKEDQALASRIITRLEEANRVCSIQTFQYQYAELRVLHYHHFLRDSSDASGADDLYELYYKNAQRTIQQLQNNYLSSLLLELELDQAKFSNNSVLRQSFQLEQDLELDPLTSLLNRASIEKYIVERMVARESGESQAVILIRIDDFKHLNDIFGHHYGDILLLQIADILNNGRASDTLVSRFSGDTFLVFMNHARSIDYIRSRADWVIDACGMIPLPDKTLEKVSISVGAAMISKPMPFDDVLEAATQALKSTGGDQFAVVR